jgi:ParB family chromosome partitioning protein
VAARKKKVRVPAAERSRGIDPRSAVEGPPPAAVRELCGRIEEDGGAVVGSYRDPLGGRWQVVALLPLEKVRPTPFQRDLSETHVERLGKAIETLGRFLDPVVCVRTEVKGPDGESRVEYWTPNGYHRTESMRKMGARSITALVLPEREAMYQILALNTEKAHNLKEKSLEVIRMARSLAEGPPSPETEYAATFEEAAFLTLGLCYEERPRFAGGVYHPVLKKTDTFLEQRLSAALAARKERAALLLALDDAVAAAVAALKERGFESPYLKNFVVARVNPLRFSRAPSAPFDATIRKMTASATSFDPAKVKADQVAQASGPPGE